MYKKIIGCFLIFSVFVCQMTVYAVTIPGVTRPFDPPAFYSPVTISLRDSTHTPFTMTYLSGQGYQVSDVQRQSQNIIGTIKSLTELMYAITRLSNELKEMASMSPEGLLAHYLGMSEDLAAIIGVWKSYNSLLSASDEMKTAWDAAFKQVDDFSHNRTSIAYRMGKNRDNLVLLEATYRDAMALAKMSDDNTKETKALQDAMQKLKSASGEQEAMQVQGQIESVRVSLLLKKNAAINTLLAVKTTKKQVELDQKLKDREDTREGAAFGVSDPYNPTDYDKKTYVRPKPQGMINF